MGESEPGQRRGHSWYPSLNALDFFCMGVVKNELHSIPLPTNCDAVLGSMTAGGCIYCILHPTSHQEEYSLWWNVFKFTCDIWVWNFDDDICLLWLGFYPVAVVGKPVKKQERGSYIQKRNNTENNKNTRNTKQNRKKNAQNRKRTTLKEYLKNAIN